MRRRLFAVVSAVSLLMFVTAIVAWSVSRYRSARTSYCFRNGSFIDVVFLDSHFLVQVEIVHPMPGDTENESGFVVNTWEYEHWTPRDYAHFAGLTWALAPSERSTDAYLSIPFWELVVIFLACPSFWLFLKARKVRSLNACHTCGYSVTGNTSGVCPECGTPVTGKAGQKA